MFDRISEGRYWDKPWTLVSGCTPCSDGCKHCWALAMEHRFYKTEAKGHGARKVNIHPERLDIPLKRKKPTVWAIWNDLFHEDVAQTFIHGTWDIMRRADKHIFLVLTKRIKRAEEFFRFKESYPNVWLGATVCNQSEADAKIPLLLQIPAAVRWVSIEPMLGPVDLLQMHQSAWAGTSRRPMIDWVILGGESGPGARPMRIEWARSVIQQCKSADVPVFMKQLGNNCIHGDPPMNYLHTGSGKDTSEWPEDLRIRQLPENHS